MTTAARTDVHREGVLVPAHYKFVDVLDLYAGTNKDDVVAKVTNASVPSAWTAFVAKMQTKVNRYRKHAIGDRPSLAQCNICGAHIRYAVVWSYFPEGVFQGFITTGLDCAESMGSAQISDVAEKAGALKEFVAGMRRKAADAEKSAQGVPAEAASRWSAIAERRRAWIVESDAHHRVAHFLYKVSTDHAEAGCEECFHCSVARQLVEEGTLSERQVEVVLRSAARADTAGVYPAPKHTIPSGRTIVRGKVLSFKGSKMLTQCTGYRVWSAAAPSAEVGSSIEFVADLEPSLRDATFLIAHDMHDVEVAG
jgi:hypothetical protein